MNVMPFSCLRPYPEHAHTFAALPYDVYNRSQARAAVARRPKSFLAIDRPETAFPADYNMYAPEVYAHAAKLFQSRIDDHTLFDDPTKSYYLYRLTLPSGHTQTGLVACCAVSDYVTGAIKQHENTTITKTMDRIAHISALHAQTGPVLLAYRDNAALDCIINAACAAAALYDFLDENGVRQTVWRCARPDALAAIEATFATIPCAYIADGHHRAAAAVAVAQEKHALSPGTSDDKSLPFNSFLAVLFPASQLVILPYHRVIADTNGMSEQEFLGKLYDVGFDIQAKDHGVLPEVSGTFGLYVNGHWYTLTAANRRVFCSDKNDPQTSPLDIDILQTHVLKPLLGIDNPRNSNRLAYVGGTSTIEELEQRAGTSGCVFSLYPTSINELMTVADAGAVMPPKSTWFEPKLQSGLFIHRI